MRIPARRTSSALAALVITGLAVSVAPPPASAATDCSTFLPSAPSNDARASSSKYLSSGVFSANGRNCWATKEVGEPAHAGQAAAKSVWLNFDTQQGYTARIDVYTSGSDFDTRLAVYTASGGTLVAQNDDATAGTKTSKVSFLRSTGGTAPSVPYKVAIDGFTRGGTTADGTYIVTWSQPLVAFTSTTHLTRSIARVYLGREPSSADYTKTVTDYKGGHNRQPGMIADTLAADGVAAALPVARLYTAVFDRLPDPSGLAYWIKKRRAGASLNEIAAAMTTSSEFTTTYGKLTNAAFVDLVYQNVLGRAPDASGRSYWINKLAGGFKRSAMMAQFSESNEFVTKSQRIMRAAVIWRLGHGSKSDAQIKAMATTHFYGVDYFGLLLEDASFKSYIAGF